MKKYSAPKLTVYGAAEKLTAGLGLGNEALIFSKDLI